MQRTPTWMYVLVLLVVVGFISMLFRNPSGLIIPLIIFLVVFWLIRYPKNGFSLRKLFQGKSNTWFRSKNSNSKRPNLYVLKRKSSDQNDEPPKYH